MVTLPLSLIEWICYCKSHENKLIFSIMGKLDVAILRYLTAEDFRVLTAVRKVLKMYL